MREVAYIFLLFIISLAHAQDVDKLRGSYYNVGDKIGEFTAIEEATFYNTISKAEALDFKGVIKKGDTVTARVRVSSRLIGPYIFSFSGYKNAFGITKSSQGVQSYDRDRAWAISHNLKLNEWGVITAIAKKDIKVKSLVVGYAIGGSIDIDYLTIPGKTFDFNNIKFVQDDGGTIITSKNVILKRSLPLGYVTPEMFDNGLGGCVESPYTCNLTKLDYYTKGNLKLNKGKIINGNNARVHLTENNNLLDIETSFFTIKNLNIHTSEHNKSAFFFDGAYGVKHGRFINVNVFGEKEILYKTGSGTKAFTFSYTGDKPTEVLDIKFDNVKVFYCAEVIDIPKTEIPFTVNTLVFDLLSWGNKRTLNIMHGDIYKGGIVVQDDDVLNDIEQGKAVFSVHNSRRSFIEYMIFDTFTKNNDYMNRHNNNIFDIKKTDSTFKFNNVFYKK